MSVTFHIELRDSDLAGFRIHCHQTDYEPGTGHGSSDHPDYGAAAAAYTAGLASGAVHRDCCSLGPVWSVDAETFSVNMANENAHGLLQALGYADEDGRIELSGSASVEDLAGRILVARALASDVGVPAYAGTGDGGSRLYDMGRPAGYYAARFDQLEALIEQCRVLGRNICWA